MVKDVQPLRQQVEELYVTLRAGLCRYLMSCGLDIARAQEATQDVFLRLYTTLRDGGTVEDPKGWVFRVAHNLAADVMRSPGRRGALEESAAFDVADDARSAEEELIARQQMAQFREILAGLPARQRQCMELRMQGMKYREIAQVLGIDISTVGELLSRAMRRFRKKDRCGA
jgi:RNA polymerase sigma-70 factor (ECF subfamily)